MAHTRFERFLPLTGVLGGVLFFAAGATTAGEPDEGDPAKFASWALAHHGVLAASGICGGLAAVMMLMFAAQVRASLRAGEGGESTYSSVAYAGGIGLSLATAFMAMLSIVLTDADATALHTLTYLNADAWVPWVVASCAFYVGTGLGALKTLALPKWLAIVTVVLGVLSVLGPAGILVFLVTPLWMIVTGIVLARRQTAGTSSVAAADYAHV